ncbi:GNAT family N-acetyltransferase [Thermomonas sp.]|uniref:GNAT family N-acetyltransferase n=1 Tax=Thermomonas sp. TaxID=1971895 RepID=UPI0035B0757B
MIGPRLEGAGVRLRGWQEADLPALSVLRSDVGLQAMLMSRARPNPVSRVREWLEERTAQADMLLLVIADRDNDAVLGYMQAAALDRSHGHCELGICLSPAAHGRGFATEALELLYVHLRDHYGLRKICLRVRCDNARAIAFYHREGYVEVGRLEGHYHEDEACIDVVLMERLLPGATLVSVPPA